MFENAAQNHIDWSCKLVGDDGKGVSFRFPGSGCVLDKNHVITASHVVTRHANTGLSTTIIRKDGVFDGNIIFESEELDIAVLKAGKAHPESNGKYVYQKYPTLCMQKVFIGQTVEFFSHLMPSEDETFKPHVVQATVKAIVGDNAETATRFELSSAVIQQGISGAAVFNNSEEIIGIVVEGRRNSGTVEDMALPIDAIPRVSPILAVRAEIMKLLQ
jgi:Trypsin-like peptidase domain